MATIAVISLKGGVGKTTVSVNLSAALSTLGKRVLLIDLDPQAGLTESLGYKPIEIKGVEFLLERDLPFEDIVQRYHANLHVLPVGTKLRLLALSMASMVAKSQDSYFYYLLSHALEPIKHNYDFIIVDCPPSAGFLSVNALTAADAAIVPAQCQHLGMKASKKTIAFISKIKRFNNSDLRALGVLPTMFDRRNRLSPRLLSHLKATYNGLLIESIIRINVSLAEAPAFGQTIFEYDPYSRGAEDFKYLAHEVVHKTAMYRGPLSHAAG